MSTKIKIIGVTDLNDYDEENRHYAGCLPWRVTAQVIDGTVEDVLALMDIYDGAFDTRFQPFSARLEPAPEGVVKVVFLTFEEPADIGSEFEWSLSPKVNRQISISKKIIQDRIDAVVSEALQEFRVMRIAAPYIPLWWQTVWEDQLRMPTRAQ